MNTFLRCKKIEDFQQGLVCKFCAVYNFIGDKILAPYKKHFSELVFASLRFKQFRMLKNVFFIALFFIISLRSDSLFQIICTACFSWLAIFR